MIRYKEVEAINRAADRVYALARTIDQNHADYVRALALKLYALGDELSLRLNQEHGHASSP